MSVNGNNLYDVNIISQRKVIVNDTRGKNAEKGIKIANKIEKPSKITGKMRFSPQPS